MILGGAEDREQEKHARLKAERQAEYNQFLNAKKSVWEEKGVRVAKIIKHKTDVPLPPHLRDAAEYYPPEVQESNNPIWGKESIQPSAKANKKKQYAAELAAQAREAAERKKREKAQSIAETRQLLAQAGEIEPDFPERQRGAHIQRDMGHYHRGYDNDRGGYDNMPPERYGAPPPDWAHGRGDAPPEELYGVPRGNVPPPEDAPYAPPPASFPPNRQESYGKQLESPSIPGGGRSPHRSNDGPPADMYGQYHDRRHYEPPPPMYGRPQQYPGRANASPTRDRSELHGRQAGMVFGAGPSQSFIRRDEANQRKAAYRQELEEQMRAVAERKAREKQMEKDIEERQEREAMQAGFHVGFSNARGGGGAPLKDDAGNVISDLNQRKARNNFPGSVSESDAPPQQGRHVEYDEQPPSGNMYKQHAAPSALARQSSETKPKPLGNFRSDHAYMLPSEMEARARKQREMQEALQEQIDAKKRIKEEQKRREQEEEMREAQRLAREQEELKAAFERENENKKAKAAEDADEMRRLAEEAYVKAKAKKNHGRPSSTGEHRSRPSSGNRGGVAEQSIAPSAVPRNHQLEDSGPPYPPPLAPERSDDFAMENADFRQAYQPPVRPPPASRMADAYDGAYRPATGGSGRTATEMARLREEIAAQQVEMKRVVQQQMHGLTKQQEREIEDLRRRAEMAEAEVANMRRSNYRQPTSAGPPYGRRASSGGRRKWSDAGSDGGAGNGGGYDVERPPQHSSAITSPSNVAGYARNRHVEQFRESRDSVVSLDASLAGDSRLIFPGAPSSRAGHRDAGAVRDLSISSLKPLPSSKKGPPINGMGKGSTESRPRSRLGTPVDVDGLLARNQDRARFLDVLQETGESNAGGNSDALDEMLIKFVELERAGKVSSREGLPPDMSMSLAGDSEWIR